MKFATNINTKIDAYKAMDSKDKTTFWKEMLRIPSSWVPVPS